MQKHEQVILIKDEQPFIKNYIFFEEYFIDKYILQLVRKRDKTA